MAFYVSLPFAVYFGFFVFTICIGVKGNKVTDEGSEKLCILVNVKLFNRKMFSIILPLIRLYWCHINVILILFVLTSITINESCGHLSFKLKLEFICVI